MEIGVHRGCPSSSIQVNEYGWPWLMTLMSSSVSFSAVGLIHVRPRIHRLTNQSDYSNTDYQQNMDHLFGRWSQSRAIGPLTALKTWNLIGINLEFGTDCPPTTSPKDGSRDLLDPQNSCYAACRGTVALKGGSRALVKLVPVAWCGEASLNEQGAVWWQVSQLMFPRRVYFDMLHEHGNMRSKEKKQAHDLLTYFFTLPQCSCQISGHAVSKFMHGRPIKGDQENIPQLTKRKSMIIMIQSRRFSRRPWIIWEFLKLYSILGDSLLVFLIFTYKRTSNSEPSFLRSPSLICHRG